MAGSSIYRAAQNATSGEPGQAPTGGYVVLFLTVPRNFRILNMHLNRLNHLVA